MNYGNIKIQNKQWLSITCLSFKTSRQVGQDRGQVPIAGACPCFINNMFFDFLCKKSEKGMRVRIIFLSLHTKKNKRLLLCVI